MNILLLVAEFFPTMGGGLANYSYNIAKCLSERNNVDVSMFPHGRSVTNYVANLEFVINMGKQLREKKLLDEVDIVYAITFQPQFSAIGFCARLLHLPFVSHGVGLDVYTSRSWYVFARKTSYGISERIICGSQFQKRIMVREGASNEKIDVVLGGVDNETFRPLKGRDEFRKALGVEGKFVLLSVGRLDKRKGFDEAIRALTYLSDIEDIILLIVGKGPEKRFLTNLTKDLSVTDKVKFLGFVSSDYLPKVYNVADLFVAPFKIIGRDLEGFPLVVQEAQACGVPVISTNTAGVPELVENGNTGFLVNMNSPREIAEKIRMLYEDRKLRKKLASNARKRAEELLDWEVVVTKIENVLRVALKQT